MSVERTTRLIINQSDKRCLQVISSNFLALVVQRVDNFTQLISRYPTEQLSFNFQIWPDFSKGTHFIIGEPLLFS